ncbi:MAG TPA: hypothetical protein VFW45_05175 [Candidatus Polarisedimenticolia bacterium]|nr:hypothetical protein [Candidatus Polarisedimenticolia bacterium]
MPRPRFARARTLSGCDTGTGRMLSGEEVNRHLQFRHAGIPSCP